MLGWKANVVLAALAMSTGAMYGRSLAPESPFSSVNNSMKVRYSRWGDCRACAACGRLNSEDKG